MKIHNFEDDPTDMKLLTAGLDVSGHQVQGKGSAEAAAGEIKRPQPEVILLDLNLPGRSGLALARSLKQPPRIPIVALTPRAKDSGAQTHSPLVATRFSSSPSLRRTSPSRFPA